MDNDEYNRWKKDGVRIFCEKRFDAIIKKYDAEKWCRRHKNKEANITPETGCAEFRCTAFVDFYILVFVRCKDPRFVVAVIEQSI